MVDMRKGYANLYNTRPGNAPSVIEHFELSLAESESYYHSMSVCLFTSVLNVHTYFCRGSTPLVFSQPQIHG
jgi:hypothetical protein